VLEDLSQSKLNLRPILENPPRQLVVYVDVGEDEFDEGCRALSDQDELP